MSRAKHGWHTPDSTAGDEICRPLFLPANDQILALVGGALSELTKPYNFEQVGEYTPEQMAEYFAAILLLWYTGECGGTVAGVPTPFWDDVTDTDDEETTGLQTWYGEVDDPALPAGELTFAENLAIWAFTGFLAVAGTPAAAILFNTSAPSFVLAMRGDDFAQVIRVIVDGEDAATVTTSGDPDELIEVPLYPDPANAVHDVLIVLKELL